MTHARCSFTLAVLALLVSCTSADHRTSVLWTDVPEVAAAVEAYNASQSDWQIQLEVHDHLATALTSTGSQPDLVIGRGLEPAAVKGALAPLDFLFDQGRVAKAQFYRELLSLGTQGGELKLLPLAFDLPILVYSTKSLPALDAWALGPERLRELSAGFDTNKGLRLAFSPLWSDFPLTLLHLTGTNFSEGFQGSLNWDAGELAKGLALLSDWTTHEAQGWKTQSEFRQKYLSTSPLPLLIDGRILFYPQHLSEFLSLPLDERRGLDFRYFEVDGHIAALDNVLWAGIPASAVHRGAAQDFLADVLLPARQAQLVAQTFSADFRPFGFLGALSSETATNVAMTSWYPELKGRIPTSAQVKFWAALPATWTTLRDAVVGPWLASGPSSSQAQDLRTAVDSWGKPQK